MSDDSNVYPFPKEGPESKLYEALKKAVYGNTSDDLTLVAILGVIDIFKADLVEDMRWFMSE